MTHNRQNIDVHHEGDAHDIVVTVQYSSGTVVDLTGAQAEWLLKENPKDDDASALLTKTGEQDVSETEIEFTEPNEGELVIHIETGDTDGLVTWGDIGGTVKDFHHRLRVTDVDGNRVTTLTGNFEIHR